nr:hypothetical protein [Mycoplasma haemofelis]
MSSLMTKFAAGAIGSSAVAGSGYGLYKMHDKGETLKSLLASTPLASSIDSYKTTFEFTKKTDTELIAMLKGKKSSVSDSSSNEDAAPLIEEWCKENIDKKVGIPDQDEILRKIKKWCVAQPSTIEGMLKKPILSTGWNDKYEGMKDQVFNDIKSTEFTDSHKEQKDKGGPALQKWCEAQVKSETHKAGASELFKKVETRCTNPS